jgi:hypothetical protein
MSGKIKEEQTNDDNDVRYGQLHVASGQSSSVSETTEVALSMK